MNCFAMTTEIYVVSLYALVKPDNTNLILFRCIRHSLDLICSLAAEENIDYFLHDTYNLFHRSATWWESCLKICKLINDGEKPLKLIPLLATRSTCREKFCQKSSRTMG